MDEIQLRGFLGLLLIKKSIRAVSDCNIKENLIPLGKNFLSNPLEYSMAAAETPKFGYSFFE